jgi:hypothetical protein
MKDEARLPAQKDWQLSDLAPVLKALQGMRFGSVEIFVQDSRMVQIDRKEKIRSFGH